MAIHENVEKRWIGGPKGFGLFAVSIIFAGEVVVRDDGVKLSKETYSRLPEERKNLTYQIAEDVVLGPLDPTDPSPEWFVNHSCDPNTMYSGPRTWTALRDIKPQEEITHDYALLWTNDFEPFEIDPCLCGALECRGKMTGDDWMLSIVEQRYAGHFPPFLQEKISAFHALQKIKPPTELPWAV